MRLIAFPSTWRLISFHYRTHITSHMPPPTQRFSIKYDTQELWRHKYKTHYFAVNFGRQTFFFEFFSVKISICLYRSIRLTVLKDPSPSSAGDVRWVFLGGPVKFEMIDGFISVTFEMLKLSNCLLTCNILPSPLTSVTWWSPLDKRGTSNKK